MLGATSIDAMSAEIASVAHSYLLDSANSSLVTACRRFRSSAAKMLVVHTQEPFLDMNVASPAERAGSQLV